jgi:hypothetical protein
MTYWNRPLERHRMPPPGDIRKVSRGRRISVQLKRIGWLARAVVFATSGTSIYYVPGSSSATSAISPRTVLLTTGGLPAQKYAEVSGAT